MVAYHGQLIGLMMERYTNQKMEGGQNDLNWRERLWNVKVAGGHVPSGEIKIRVLEGYSQARGWDVTI